MTRRGDVGCRFCGRGRAGTENRAYSHIKDNACDSAFWGDAKERKTLHLPEDGAGTAPSGAGAAPLSVWGGSAEELCRIGFLEHAGQRNLPEKWKGECHGAVRRHVMRSDNGVPSEKRLRTRRTPTLLVTTFFKKRSYLLVLTYAERMTAQNGNALPKQGAEGCVVSDVFQRFSWRCSSPKCRAECGSYAFLRAGFRPLHFKTLRLPGLRT